MTILVTDGSSRAALAITRSLGKLGHKIVVGDSEGTSLAGASKYCAERIVYPDPSSDKRAFVQYIREAVLRLNIHMLLPVTDITTLTIADHASEFPDDCRLPFHGNASLLKAADKTETMDIARQLDIPTPDSIVVNSPALDVSSLPNWSFPIVLKPARSRVPVEGKWHSTSVSYAVDSADLMSQLDSLPSHAYPVILQERIEGPGIGIFLCMDRGKVLASFSHRRLREKPPSGGVSVLRESIGLNQQALDFSTRLLKAMDWYGVAMVEFKLDKRDQTPKLMEINGRFWGSLQLAIDAGVNFPEILVRLALGEDIRPVHDYKLGVRSRWFWGEVDLLLLYLLKSSEQLQLPSGHDSRTKSILKVLNPFISGQHFEVLRLSDIKPWLQESRRWFRK